MGSTVVTRDLCANLVQLEGRLSGQTHVQMHSVDKDTSAITAFGHGWPGFAISVCILALVSATMCQMLITCEVTVVDVKWILCYTCTASQPNNVITNIA